MGTNVRAQDIAIKRSVCSWNPDMYGVDATKPEGQAYYNSIVQMYADWGVDFIKCDDISRPYDEVQRAEVEALRKAIDKTGRPIVLSLSPSSESCFSVWKINESAWFSLSIRSFLVAIDEPFNINSAMKAVEFIYSQLLSTCMAKGGDIIAGGTIPDH
jgi:S-methylmethionine-dependent homocysteine/selenocysteine methylase